MKPKLTLLVKGGTLSPESVESLKAIEKALPNDFHRILVIEAIPTGENRI
jgi:hypothetical protein